MKKIIIENATKYYKKNLALCDVSFEIDENEIFGIIGPNGAGKTTLLESMLGLRSLTRGRINIFGLDSKSDHKKLVRVMGAQLQQAEMPTNLKVKEAIKLQAALFSVKVNENKLLQEYNLLEKANSYYYKLSGGQKQRLFILLASIHNPDILFFDELSTGLDPVSRREVWKNVLRFKEQGKTVIVSTHLMEEAEALCDRVAIIERGNLKKIGRIPELLNELPFTHIVEFESVSPSERIVETISRCKEIIGIENESSLQYRIFLRSYEEQELLKNLLEQNNIKTTKWVSRNCNFDDYFYYTI